MSGLAIVLMIAGVICLAIHAVSQRYLLRTFSIGAVLTIGMGTSCIFFLTSLLWWPKLVVFMSWQTPIRNDPVVFWLAIIWTTAWNVFIQYATARSRQCADLSLTQPFQALTPGLITAAAILLHEYPTSVGVSGIVLISLATYLHGREGAHTLREWLQPFRMIVWLPADFTRFSLEQRERALKDRSGIRWAVASAGAGTFGLLGDGVAARHGDIITGLAFLTGVLTLSYGLAYWLSSKGAANVRGKSPTVCNTWRKDYWVLALTGGAFALAHLFIFSAFRVAEIPYIGTLKRLSIIATVILAAIVLKERTRLTRRLVIGAIAVVGATLLAFDSNAEVHILNSAEEYLISLLRVFHHSN